LDRRTIRSIVVLLEDVSLKLPNTPSKNVNLLFHPLFSINDQRCTDICMQRALNKETIVTAETHFFPFRVDTANSFA